jgi:hypothetical protein
VVRKTTKPSAIVSVRRYSRAVFKAVVLEAHRSKKTLLKLMRIKVKRCGLYQRLAYELATNSDRTV